MPYTILHELHRFPCSTPGAGYLFTLQSACNGELEEAWIVNKSINCFFASLVVESSQKSLMILKMLLSLKALSL